MSRCRCGRKMRLKRDGWKRCGRCGAEKMGITLRAQVAHAERMDKDPEYRAGWQEIERLSAEAAEARRAGREFVWPVTASFQGAPKIVPVWRPGAAADC